MKVNVNEVGRSSPKRKPGRLTVRLANIGTGLDPYAYKQEWDPEPLFDGRICKKGDVKRVFSFTVLDDIRMKTLEKQREHLEAKLRETLPQDLRFANDGVVQPEVWVDWEKMGKLLRELGRQGASTELKREMLKLLIRIEEVDDELKKLSHMLQEAEDMTEYETTLFNRQLTVSMAFGNFTGMADSSGGDYGEFLTLKGPLELIARIWPVVAIADYRVCRRCRRGMTLAEYQDSPNRLCSQCDVERKARKFETKEDEYRWIIDSSRDDNRGRRATEEGEDVTNGSAEILAI